MQKYMIATKAKSRKLEVRKCDCMRAFKCSEISLRCIIKRNHILKMNSMERKRSYREKYGESKLLSVRKRFYLKDKSWLLSLPLLDDFTYESSDLCDSDVSSSGSTIPCNISDYE